MASKMDFNERLRLRASPIMPKIVAYWLSVRLLEYVLLILYVLENHKDTKYIQQSADNQLFISKYFKTSSKVLLQHIPTNTMGVYSIVEADKLIKECMKQHEETQVEWQYRFPYNHLYINLAETSGYFLNSNRAELGLKYCEFFEKGGVLPVKTTYRIESAQPSTYGSLQPRDIFTFTNEKSAYYWECGEYFTPGNPTHTKLYWLDDAAGKGAFIPLSSEKVFDGQPTEYTATVVYMWKFS